MGVRVLPRSDATTWTTALALSVPVLLVAAVAPHARPVVDDLCYEARIEVLGVGGTWWFYVTNWSGTWLQHLGSSLVAAPDGYWGYGLQSLALLLGLLVLCQIVTRSVPSASLAWRLAATAGLAGCCLAALQGSLVGPAYPGLAGTFAFPAAGLLHLLPLLLWLPLTVHWWSGPQRRPPLLAGGVLAVLLTGLGIAEGLGTALVWTLLGVVQARGTEPDRRVAARWLAGAAVLGLGLVANYLSPGSRNRADLLLLEPSSAALTNGPVVDLPLYVVLYAGGILTSPGVWAAALLGIAVARAVGAGTGRSDLVLLAAVPSLLLAQAAAAVFAYPAFWHLQPVQVAAALAAFALGRRWSAASDRRSSPAPAPSPLLVLTTLVVLAVAVPPALVTQRAVATRGAVLDAARTATKASAPGTPAVPAAYALGRRDGAKLPDAGAGDPGYGRCWALALGRTDVVDREEPTGPRAVLPTITLPFLGQ